MSNNTWNPKGFTKSGGYIHYEGKFVARFRSYHKGRFGWGSFKKALLAQHTPASYFAALESGKAPMQAVTL